MAPVPDAERFVRFPIQRVENTCYSNKKSDVKINFVQKLDNKGHL